MGKAKPDETPEEPTVTPEVVEPEPEPETVERLVVEWDGESWEVPSADDMPYDATVAFARLAKAEEDGDQSMVSLTYVDDFLASMLGARQYRRLVRGRTVKQVNEFPAAVFARWGAERGE